LWLYLHLSQLGLTEVWSSLHSSKQDRVKQ
jgi:hypothetical protein